MPRTCSVYGCRSNYRSQKKESISTFGLPKDPLLRTQWLLRIRTDFKNVKNPVICIKHFDESVIIRTDRFLVKGEWVEFRRKLPKLKPGALPTIFPSVPSSSSPPLSNCLADVIQEIGEEVSDENLSSGEELLWISSLDDIINFYNNSLSKRGSNWICIRKYGKIFLCLVDTTNNRPTASGCIAISESLEFEVFADKVPRMKLPVETASVRSLIFLEELINFVENNRINRNETESLESTTSFIAQES